MSLTALDEDIDLTHRIWPLLNTTSRNVTLVGSKGTPKIITPGNRLIFPKQAEFLRAIRYYKKTLYGGSMGSGKSWILRWALLDLLIDWSAQGINNVRVGLFSETLKALKARHVRQIQSDFRDFGDYHIADYEFRLFSEYGGGSILLCHTEDEQQYKSIDFAAIGDDELTMQPESVMDFLLLRLRWPGIDHTPFFAATNPTGMGAAWVKRRFVNPDTRDKPEYDTETGHQDRGAYFIQALPRDNPSLSPAYIHELKKKPPHLRDAYLLGKWDKFEGQFYGEVDWEYVAIRPFAIPPEWNIYIGMDFATAHTAATVIIAVDFKGTAYVIDCVSAVGLTADQYKRVLFQRLVNPYTKEPYKITLAVADPSMWEGSGSVEGNKTPVEVFNRRDDGMGCLDLVPANNSRKARWAVIREGFRYEFAQEIDKHGNTIKRALTQPTIRIFDTCAYLFSSLQGLQYRETGEPDDCKKPLTNIYQEGEGDDESDAFGYTMLQIRPSVNPHAVQRPYDSRRYVGRERQRILQPDQYSNIFAKP